MERIRGLKRLLERRESAIAGMADKQEFEEVAMPYLDNVFRMAVTLCRSRPQAHDLTQTTFMKALRQFGSFEIGTNCKAWLLRILRNTWLDWLRHEKVSGTTVPIDETDLIGPPQADVREWNDAKDILDRFSDEQVIDAMCMLPEDQRLAVLLVDVEEMSQEGAAEMLDVPVGTIKSRTSRARLKLKTLLTAHAKDLGILGRRKP